MPKTLPHIPAASRRFGFMMKFYANRAPEIMLSFGLAGAGVLAMIVIPPIRHSLGFHDKRPYDPSE
eukprot:CAMPEP_0201543264 /NCGR_PEP_ID=MMETSP0161_2-20130828/72501_1 /ASSEMBLY_ACC=CAM_ASM_000251 /TAXON_ID=180227 /ORGANISM="Neoparamoeba aestuarina, Strain SoJaBio B1-5/56/2" /LENGTH=65 /DNA_ID=CAMNT_0047951021 /DNA_START=74 /DNA_END=271 /DNA_ORIENTATION=-